jgi:hypothetical protein
MSLESAVIAARAGLPGVGSNAADRLPPLRARLGRAGRLDPNLAKIGKRYPVISKSRWLRVPATKYPHKFKCLQAASERVAAGGFLVSEIWADWGWWS